MHMDYSPQIRFVECSKMPWQGHHLHCFQLCCARLTCSWCLKMPFGAATCGDNTWTSLFFWEITREC